mmetsp:Transcript_1588/g.4613  ORF Transcript_1588/g.4613 Transcript_1588/m.4613 type:complete len:110 (+) Transcript_1588:157-486(+)
MCNSQRCSKLSSSCLPGGRSSLVPSATFQSLPYGRSTSQVQSQLCHISFKLMPSLVIVVSMLHSLHLVRPNLPPLLEDVLRFAEGSALIESLLFQSLLSGLEQNRDGGR